MNVTTDVVVVGAGPYGLSIGAHLRRRGIDFRIFGFPMQTWRTAMPKGMFLKSEVSASSLSDPDQNMSLPNHCAASSISCAEGSPIALETILDYGLAFQRKLVPELEQCAVENLAEKQGAFELRLETGEAVRARRVILAVGTTYFAHRPSQLTTLPPDLVSHSQEHSDFTTFPHRDVVVIGGGQSALETAALLHEQGARVRVIARAQRLGWNPPPSGPPTGLSRLLRPHSGLGSGYKLWFYCNAPGVFQYFPEDFRARVVGRALGPAGAWWLKDRVLGRFPVQCGNVVREAREKGGKVCLSVASSNGSDGHVADVYADHVIAATGYKVDLGLLSFLDAGLSHRIRRAGKGPALSSHFESSVAGLYFAGLAAAGRFGPSMRFMVGVDYNAHKIVSALRSGHVRTERALSPDACKC